MTDFREAFLQGQAAVDRAKAAKAEISEIFARLAGDVAEVTAGAVQLGIETFPKGAYGSAFLALTIATAKLIHDAEPIPTEQWITARSANSREGKPLKLARWTQSDTGYPCAIRYSDTDDNIHDKKALEQALATFVANPWVGEQLRRLSEANSNANVDPSDAPVKMQGS